MFQYLAAGVALFACIATLTGTSDPTRDAQSVPIVGEVTTSSAELVALQGEAEVQPPFYPAPDPFEGAPAMDPTADQPGPAPVVRPVVMPVAEPPPPQWTARLVLRGRVATDAA